MKCPQCEVGLKATDQADTDVMTCAQCKGVWIGSDKRDAPESMEDPGFRHAGAGVWVEPSQFDIRETGLRCPQCGTMPMRAVVNRHDNMHYNICVKCKGTWLAASHYDDIARAMADYSLEAGADDPPDSSPFRRGRPEEAGGGASTPITEKFLPRTLKRFIDEMNYRILEDHPEIRKIVEGLERSLPL